MGIEIERKFLVSKSIWDNVEKGKPSYLRQGYLTTDPYKIIRVRVSEEQGFLTIKGKTDGIARAEFEYEIPRDEALQLLDSFSESDIEKNRYKVLYKGKTWEVDEFRGANEGLILAEIELTSVSEHVELPEWVSAEVSAEERYYNSSLSRNPFRQWKNEEKMDH